MINRGKSNSYSNEEFTITYGGLTIREADVVKYLGVLMLNNEFTWDVVTNKIIKNTSTVNGMLRQLSTVIMLRHISLTQFYQLSISMSK